MQSRRPLSNRNTTAELTKKPMHVSGKHENKLKPKKGQKEVKVVNGGREVRGVFGRRGEERDVKGLSRYIRTLGLI